MITKITTNSIEEIKSLFDITRKITRKGFVNIQISDIVKGLVSIDVKMSDEDLIEFHVQETKQISESEE